MTEKHLLNPVYFFLIAIGLFLALITTSVEAENNSPVLITYTYEHELLPKLGNEPLLTIYSNGSMRAVFPSNMKLAGVRNAQISPTILQALITLISTNTIQGLNNETISEEIELYQAQQEQTGNEGETIYAVLDSTTTTIEFKPFQSNSTRKITFKDLSLMAKQFSGIAGIQALNNLMEILQGILDTSDWVISGENS